MSAEIKVSVLCTAFNHEQYLSDALDSFLAQRTDFPFEVLVNDDRSTDGTAELLRHYAEKYPKIIVPFYQRENLYSQKIDIYEHVFFPAARGKYFAFCEGDDYWLDADKLQRQADFLDAHSDYSACVHGSYQKLCGSGEPDRVYIRREADCDIPYTDILSGMDKAYHTSSLMAVRSALLPLPEFYHIGVDHSFGDYPQALWLAMNGATRYLSGPMSVYRVKSGGASWTAKVGRRYDKLTEFVAGEIEVLESLSRMAPTAWEEAVRDTLLRRQYELLYLQGRTRELTKPPFDRLYREEPLTFRVKNSIKTGFPALHGLYRSLRGYKDEDQER